MTVTAGDTHTILTSADPIRLTSADPDRADPQRAWDLAVGHDPVATSLGGAPVALWGLARWAARRDPAGWVEHRVSVPGDDEETRRRKALCTLALILIMPFGVVWAGLYFKYGEPAAALASVFYVVVTIAGVVLLFRFRNFTLFWWTELALAFPVPVATQLVLGGFVGSGAVILWSFLAALLVAMFVGAREAWWWFGAFVLAVVACSALQPYVRVQNHLPTWLISVFFALNITSVCAVSLVFLHSFARDRRKLRELEVSYLNQEMMLRQADKLATLGTLAAGVAHELNNPAAAAARGVGQLRPLIERLQSACPELCAASPQLAAS